MSLLEIKNLTVRFETRQGAVEVVRGVDFSAEEGRCTAIVGESGSGKSVAMMAVMGLLPPSARITADKMMFQGQDLLGARPRLLGAEMAMIFQEPMTSLNPCFTVQMQIEEMLRKHTKLTGAARKKRCLELLDMVGIPAPERVLTSYPHQLSGGMNQRVMIAMMISCSPKLLIADEPTTALDVTVQAQILDVLRRLQKELNMALVMITHDMGVVANLADDVMVQYGGKIVEVGSVMEIFDRPQHPYTAALLAALPERAVGMNRLQAIEGVVPAPHAWPEGCVFHPRCAFVQEKCRHVEPVYPRVQCHFPLGGGHGA